MATRIIEYGGASQGSFPVVPANQSVAFQAAMTATGTSAQSAAFDSSTSLVLVQSDEAIYLRFGANPTATTDNYRLPAAQEQFFAVTPGQSWKVAIRT